MYLLIIFLIIGGLISYFNAKEFSPFCLSDFFGGLVITIICYFFFTVAIRMVTNANTYEFEYKDQPITSLINKEVGSINGSFILGCGSISGDNDYYVAYANFPQGSLRIKVNAYNIYVQETDSISPIIKNYWVRKNTKGFKSNWIWDKKPFVGEWYANTGITGDRDRIVIVPKNTIYKEFQIKD